MANAGVLADAIHLPGIVGAFLAGLAVNASVREKPASAKLEFLSKIAVHSDLLRCHGVPDQPGRMRSGIINHVPFVAGIIAALLVGKSVAAWVVGRTFGYIGSIAS